MDTVICGNIKQISVHLVVWYDVLNVLKRHMGYKGCHRESFKPASTTCASLTCAIIAEQLAALRSLSFAIEISHYLRVTQVMHVAFVMTLFTLVFLYCM